MPGQCKPAAAASILIKAADLKQNALAQSKPQPEITKLVVLQAARLDSQLIEAQWVYC
jgi:hypothetical protein